MDLASLNTRPYSRTDGLTRASGQITPDALKAHLLGGWGPDGRQSRMIEEVTRLIGDDVSTTPLDRGWAVADLKIAHDEPMDSHGRQPLCRVRHPARPGRRYDQVPLPPQR